MVVSVLVGMVLAAGPRGLPDAELVVVAPKVADVEALAPFFTRAGQGSLLVAPSGWRESAHPLLAFDVTRPESIAGVGIAPAEPLTLSQRGTVTMSCHGVGDRKRFEAACRERLERLGTFARSEAAGVTTLMARDGLNRVQAAALIKGKEACVVGVPGQSVEKLLPDAAKALSTSLVGAPFKAMEPRGPVSLLFTARPRGGFTTLSLSARGDALTVDGRGKGLPFSELSGAGSSPFAGLSPSGLMTLTLRLKREGLDALAPQLLGGLPGGRALGPAAKALSPTLTGNVAVHVSRVRVSSGLRTTAARFFALKFVVLAETKAPDDAQAIIDALDPKALSFPEGTLRVGRVGATVWLTNDVETKDQALAALPASPGAQAHGAVLALDPKALAKGLSAVPLLEVLQSPELSGFLVAATEVGPLLLLTQRIDGWLDSQGPGQHRGQLVWTLEPERPDAGTPRSP